MKKSNFVALILGTVSGILFSIGMCMALLPEWNAFTQGIIFGSAGLALGLVTVMVWRKMEKKAPVRISGKLAFRIALGIAGALLLGVGMCLCMVWDKILLGILIGIGGIILLLCLIPLSVGLRP